MQPVFTAAEMRALDARAIAAELAGIVRDLIGA